jgi:phage host-nuclease inhibitor protein Gam
MTREEILAFAEADALEAPRAVEWEIDGRDTLEWAMGALAEDAEEISRIRSAQAEAVARVEARAAELVRKVERRGAYFRGKVEEYARSHRADLLTGKSKTVGLIHGEIAYRATADRLEVEDAAAALEWARTQPVDADMVRVKQEINKRALGEHFKRTGEIPPGCAVVPASESIHINPEQPEALVISPSRKEITP